MPAATPSYFAEVSLDQWMCVGPELADAPLKLDQQVMDALRKTKARDVDSDRGLTDPR
jgi:hypothetical protein